MDKNQKTIKVVDRRLLMKNNLIKVLKKKTNTCCVKL